MRRILKCLEPPAKKGICTSRSFGQPNTTLDLLQEAVATYMTRTAFKLRKQKSRCSQLSVFLETNLFNPNAGGTVLSVSVESASPHEVKLVEKVLEERFMESLPAKLIGEKAYDSDQLDEMLQQQGIEMIAPHRRNRKSKKTQDGRKLRRYKRRWKVERFFAWLFNYRKCVTRNEYKVENYKAFLLLACMLILLKSFMR